MKSKKGSLLTNAILGAFFLGILVLALGTGVTPKAQQSASDLIKVPGQQSDKVLSDFNLDDIKPFTEYLFSDNFEEETSRDMSCDSYDPPIQRSGSNEDRAKNNFNNLEQEFKDKVEIFADRFNVETEEAYAVMAFETGGTFDPCIQNGIGATGLIQFTRSTAEYLGTSTSELALMTRSEQMEYVTLYFSRLGGSKIQNFQDLYMTIFLPKYVGEPAETQIIIQDEEPETYKNNKGLDINEDGVITAGEAAEKARALYPTEWFEESRGLFS